jgi:DNA-binding transcriptional LysR family regulator
MTVIKHPTAELGAPAPRTFVRMPELIELRALCAAVDLGSISAAARSMHVSQPALSKRLRTLEGLVRARLLERTTRGVTPTPAGLRMYGAARRLLAEADAVEALVIGSSASVRLAVSPTVADRWWPQVLANLTASEGYSLSIDVLTANSSLVRQMIRDGRSELGVAALEPGGAAADGLTEKPLIADEILVAVPAGHPWVATDEIDPVEFADTAVVRGGPGANSSEIVDSALRRVGLMQVAPVAEIGNPLAAVATAKARHVPVLLPRIAAREYVGPDLVTRRVKGLRFERQFALVFAGWLDGLLPPARALARHLLALADATPPVKLVAA